VVVQSVEREFGFATPGLNGVRELFHSLVAGEGTMIRVLVIATVLFLVAAGGPAPVRADQGDPMLIHACVNRSGELRILAPNATCKRKEMPLHWPAAGSGRGFWRLQGNQGTTPPTQFLGTTDTQPLVFKTFGREAMRIDSNGRIGIGLSTPTPGQKLHLGDGNILLEGGGETALQVKRDFSVTGGVSGTSTNPIFQLGRIQTAGDGDPEFRVLYEDDEIRQACPPQLLECARSVLKFDRKGIVASVKPSRGSHFEGFLEGVVDGVPKGDVEPVFRLNSLPAMQLELGPGGDQPTDVFIRREAERTMTMLTGNAERVRVGPEGLQIVSGYLHLTTITGGAPAATDCESPAHTGRLVVRTDGPPDLYVCLGARGWVGK
jgi:hypothetical protein